MSNYRENGICCPLAPKPSPLLLAVVLYSFASECLLTICNEYSRQLTISTHFISGLPTEGQQEQCHAACHAAFD